MIQEETVLRRRLLLRLLRGFNFENPRYRGEVISNLVPPELITSELTRHNPNRVIEP
ncbi:peptidyl-tRNA hydrolase [Phaeobacter sp. C3_T13_0]|uniref:peptidyl-tRNA hydrolase n=1 Tax=Phaeobacter cretensis TaxID=3342641 RepID=UPI0039BCE438